jgi:beta-phosphoglucomutase
MKQRDMTQQEGSKPDLTTLFSGKIDAVLFDMDGVLIDSEDFIARAAIEMFRQTWNIKVSQEDFQPFIGAGENRYLGGVAEKYGIPIDIERDKEETYRIYGEIIRGQLKELPGAKAFVEGCRQRGLKIALATSADRVKMEVSLAEIGLPLERFDTLVNGLDVEHKKPAPDIYLEAARRLSVPPERTLVVEDALNGVQAAKAAGALCLGITSSFSASRLIEAGADFTAPDLGSLA